MAGSQRHEQASILAEPLSDSIWRVCEADSTEFVESTMGFISQLGGTYEVRVLHAPQRHEFVPTFKEAMECFKAVAS